MLSVCSPPPGSQSQIALCAGHTDRSVAVYLWNRDSLRLELLKKLLLSGQVRGHNPRLLVLIQDTIKFFVIQIGSLAVGRGLNGSPQVLVSQPGGTYMPIFSAGKEEEGKKE